MKQALTVGCGSGNGKIIVDKLINKGYTVTNIGSSPHAQANNIIISWKDFYIPDFQKMVSVNGNLDFVFFSQNASSLDSSAFDFSKTDTLQAWKLIKDWQHSHWISCQMPFLLIQKLQKNLHAQSKIGWMLSSTMMWNRDEAMQFPDYSSQKYFNYLAMINFGKHYQTFGIMPDFSMDDSAEKMATIIDQVCDNFVSNKVFSFHNSTE